MTLKEIIEVLDSYLIFGFIVAAFCIIVCTYNIIKLFKNMYNSDYKYKKSLLIGVGLYVLIFIIVGIIKNGLLNN